MIDITRWGKIYNPRPRIGSFIREDMKYDELDRVLNLSEELLHSSLDLSYIDRITHTFWLNMMDRKKKNDYTPNRWTYARIGQGFYEEISRVRFMVIKNRVFKLVNILQKSIECNIPHLFDEDKPFAVFALALIIWYFPNYLTKKEQKIYSNLSFEEMYNLVTGDNSLRGIDINDKNLYME